MDSNKRRTVIPLAIITVIFLTFSTFLTISLFKDSNTDYISNYQGIFDRSGVIINELKKTYKVDLDSTDLKEVSEKLYKDNKKFIAEKSIVSDYFKPPFEFVILSDKLVVTRLTAKYAYQLGINIGDEITKVNGKKISDLKYFKIFDEIYAEELNSKITVTINSTDLEIELSAYNNSMEISSTEDAIIYTIYDLDKTLAYSLYSSIVSGTNIVINLEKATVNTLYSIKTYLSLFSNSNDVILTEPEETKGVKLYKINNNVTFVVGNNKDQGIRFLLTEIKGYNLPNVSFDCLFDEVNFCQISGSKAVSTYNINFLNYYTVSNKKN